MYNIFLLFFPFEQTRLPGVPFSRTQTRTHTHTHFLILSFSFLSLAPSLPIFSINRELNKLSPLKHTR